MGDEANDDIPAESPVRQPPTVVVSRVAHEGKIHVKVEEKRRRAWKAYQQIKCPKTPMRSGHRLPLEWPHFAGMFGGEVKLT